MSEGGNQSEIARFRAFVERECRAMYLYVNGYRVAASHEVITHQMNVVGQRSEQFARLTGNDRQATEIVCEIYDQVVNSIEEENKKRGQ